MMERKNGMRLPAVVLLAALAFSCFAPAALATAEEPPEDLPAAVSAQDGAQEETTLPGADAAQQDSAAGTGAANPHETIATSVQENPRFAKPQLDIPCRNAILISIDTGDILYEKEPDAEVPMASITKIMTLLLTLEAVEAGKISMTDIVPISEHAFNMGGSQIWLEPGEQFTLDELIKAICVCSANDAAVAVAEFVGGSEPVFAEMMNARAAELGMTHTRFVNACGLDAEGHYSSARDVAAMSLALLRHPKILEYSGIWMDTLRGGETQLTNTNKMLKSYAGITGLKTGTTNGAGVCISASAVRGRRISPDRRACGHAACDGRRGTAGGAGLHRAGKDAAEKRRGPDADGGRCASGKAGRTCGGRHAGGFRNAEGGGRNTG